MDKKIDKIKILVVDDKKEMLHQIKDDFKSSHNQDKEGIELSFFGIDVYQNKIFNKKQISTEIEEYIDTNGFDFNILLIDFSMPNRNGLVVIERLKEKNFAYPIIIMTAHEEVVQENILDTLQKGAKRYLYKHQNYFIDELIITAKQIMEEYHNEKMIELTEQLVDKRYHDYEEFACSFSKAIFTHISNTYCIIRKYNSHNDTLLKIHPTGRLSIKEEVSHNDCCEMYKAIENENGINISNSLSLKNFPELVPELGGDTIKLLSVRVGDRNNPKGLVNIFRRKIGADFTKREAYFIKFAVNMIENKIALEEQEKNFKNILSFISKIIVMEDENLICQLFSDVVHQEFNDNDNQATKLTIKFLKLGEDILSCKQESCQQRGIERENYEPFVPTSNSVSATVYNYNIPILIENIDKIKDAREAFKADFLSKYGCLPSHNEENFKYKQSAKNAKIKSELCVPLSIEKIDKNSSPDTKILGVLNLESTKVGFYTKKEKNLLEILSKVVALRIDNIRHKKFLDGITNIIKIAEDAEKLKALLKLFEKITKYHLLTLYTIDKEGNINFEDLEVDKAENRAQIISELKEITKQKKGYVFSLHDKLKEEEPIYIGNIQNTNDYYRLKSLKNEIKSSLIQPIFAYGALVGVLTLQYTFESPLMKSEIDLLGKVANWLGYLYLTQDEHKKNLNYLLIKRYAEKFSSNFRHSVINQVKKTETILEKLSAYDIKSVETLNKIFLDLKTITKHYENVTNSETFKEIISEVKIEFSHRLYRKFIFNTIKIRANPYISKEKRTMIYVIVFHILDNAFDILKEHIQPKIDIEGYIHNKMFYILLCNNGERIKNVEKIFEPDYTTKPHKGGFGLYHVRDIVKENYGDVRAINQTDRVCFQITLPLGGENEI